MLDGEVAEGAQGRERRYILPVCPSTNVYYRHVGKMVKISAAGRKYKELIANIFAGCKPVSGPVELEIWVYRPRNAGDIDNFTGKALLDALQGYLYENDSQVTDTHNHIRTSHKAPRIELVMRVLDHDPRLPVD